MEPTHRVRRQPAVTRLLLLSLLGTVVLAGAGCAGDTPAPKMAAIQPEPRDLSVLRPGTPRALVVAQLGQPIWSGQDGEGRVDVFDFKQGYSRATRVTRAVLHGVADVLTLGLWEIVGRPIETIYSGTPMRVEVAYDAGERVRVARAPGEALTRRPRARRARSAGRCRRHRLTATLRPR